MGKQKEPFYFNKPSRDEVEFIKHLAEIHGVKLFFKVSKKSNISDSFDNHFFAFSIPYKKEIYINLKTVKTIKALFVSFFHELQHCINYDERKYYNYHKKMKNFDDLKKKISLKLRAEMYTDYRAQKLMKNYFPYIPYHSAYNTKYTKEHVRFENQLAKLVIKINQKGNK